MDESIRLAFEIGKLRRENRRLRIVVWLMATVLTLTGGYLYYFLSCLGGRWLFFSAALWGWLKWMKT